MSWPMSIGAEMQAGKRRSMNMHNLVVSCLVAAYLAIDAIANAVAAARSSPRALLPIGNIVFGATFTTAAELPWVKGGATRCITW